MCVCVDAPRHCWYDDERTKEKKKKKGRSVVLNLQEMKGGDYCHIGGIIIIIIIKH